MPKKPRPEIETLLLRTIEVAKMLDTTPARVHELRREGKITSIQHGKRNFRFTRSSVLGYLDGQMKGGIK
jgi:hypothetical protein